MKMPNRTKVQRLTSSGSGASGSEEPQPSRHAAHHYATLISSNRSETSTTAEDARMGSSSEAPVDTEPLGGYGGEVEKVITPGAHHNIGDTPQTRYQREQEKKRRAANLGKQLLELISTHDEGISHAEFAYLSREMRQSRTAVTEKGVEDHHQVAGSHQGHRKRKRSSRSSIVIIESKSRRVSN